MLAEITTTTGTEPEAAALPKRARIPVRLEIAPPVVHKEPEAASPYGPSSYGTMGGDCCFEGAVLAQLRRELGVAP